MPHVPRLQGNPFYRIIDEFIDQAGAGMTAGHVGWPYNPCGSVVLCLSYCVLKATDTCSADSMQSQLSFWDVGVEIW